jgi:hypothetical protein
MYKENNLVNEYKKYIINLYDNYDLSMTLVILHSYFLKRSASCCIKNKTKTQESNEFIISSIIDVFTWFNNLFPTKTFGICEIKKLISNKKNIYKYMKHCKNVGATSKEVNEYIDKLIEDKMNNFITICNENKKLQLKTPVTPSVKNSIYNYNKSLEKISISNIGTKGASGTTLSYSPLHKNFVISTNKKKE